MRKYIMFFTAVLMFATMSFAQGKIGLGFNGGIVSPSGDLGDIYKSGFGGSGVLSFKLTDNILLSGTVGYYSMNIDNDKVLEKAGLSGSNIELDAPLTIIPVMVGAKYLFSTLIVKPYVSLELGIHSMSIDEASATVNGTKVVFAKNASQSETAWAVGAGAYISISPKLELEISAKYNGNGAEAGTSSTTSSGSTVTTESSSSTFTFLTLFAGINIAL